MAKSRHQINKDHYTKRKQGNSAFLEQAKLKQARRRAKHRALLDKMKLESGCSICGYARCPAALEYHHTDPQTKYMPVGGMYSCSWKKIMAEVAKCVLLCSNCHKEVHYGDL